MIGILNTKKKLKIYKYDGIKLYKMLNNPHMFLYAKIIMTHLSTGPAVVAHVSSRKGNNSHVITIFSLYETRVEI